jgi:hypothetical protein
MHDCSIIGKKPTLLPYHGWLVVAAAFLVALYGFGLGFYGPGIYLVALKALHGWPTLELSSAHPRPRAVRRALGHSLVAGRSKPGSIMAATD